MRKSGRLPAGPSRANREAPDLAMDEKDRIGEIAQTPIPARKEARGFNIAETDDDDRHEQERQIERRKSFGSPHSTGARDTLRANPTIAPANNQRGTGQRR